MKILPISTNQHNQMINVTEEVSRAIKESGIKDGFCVVCTPHTTTAVTVNENTDANVKTDLLARLDDIVPWAANYRHQGGNSAAHIKSSLIGSSVEIMVEDGKPLLGTWQSIYFLEFDGPRNRMLYVKVK